MSAIRSKVWLSTVFWKMCRLTRGYTKTTVLKAIGMSSIAVFLYLVAVQTRSASLSAAQVGLLYPAKTFLLKSSEIHPQDLGFLNGISETKMLQDINEFKNTLQKLNCSNREVSGCFGRRRKKKSLLTLFTSWEYDSQKFHINNNTLHNWKMLPEVNLIVFTNSSKVRRLSETAGWSVLPIQQAFAGAPVLSVMFAQAKAAFNSHFYGYANGDLLFTENLIRTLEGILCNVNTRQRLLLVGKRTNIPSERVNGDAAVTFATIEDLATREGTLFQSDAEDYFITDEGFPWEQFPPVVIGRRGYDNWVVAFSRYKGFMVVDGSHSVLALHQTLAARGDYEGLNKPAAWNNYNVDLVQRSHTLPYRYGLWGHTTCAEWRTWLDVCDTVVLQKRRVGARCVRYKNLFEKMFGDSL